MAETNDPLERFFEAGRRAAEAPSENLLRRVEADALRELDRRAGPAGSARAAGWRGVVAALGGWRAGVGLATAAVAGLVLGVSLSSVLATGLDDLSLTGSDYELGDLAPGYGLALLEDG